MTKWTRDIWYKHPEVIFNIINAVKERETAFLGKADQKVPPIRNVFANYTNFLTRNFEKFDFYNRKYNLYYSLARFKNIRLFSFAPPVRKEQSKKWNKEFLSEMKSIDLGLDFDAPNLEQWKKAYEDCKLVKKHLDAYGVPYSLKWSGGKSFHIRIPYHALPEHLELADDRDNQNAVSLLNKSFAEILSIMMGAEQGKDNLETLDMGVFDYRRVWKCDYSFVCETGLIALPLSAEQFDNFSLEMVKPDNVIQMGIRNRFDLMRKGGKENFKEYCNKVLCIEL